MKIPTTNGLPGYVNSGSTTASKSEADRCIKPKSGDRECVNLSQKASDLAEAGGFSRRVEALRGDVQRGSFVPNVTVIAMALVGAD